MICSTIDLNKSNDNQSDIINKFKSSWRSTRSPKDNINNIEFEISYPSPKAKPKVIDNNKLLSAGKKEK